MKLTAQMASLALAFSLGSVAEAAPAQAPAPAPAVASTAIASTMAQRRAAAQATSAAPPCRTRLIKCPPPAAVTPKCRSTLTHKTVKCGSPDSELIPVRRKPA